MNPEGTTAEEFAAYIVEKKPYLVEIDEEIQAVQRQNSEAKIKIEIHIRGRNVVKIDFWRNHYWMRKLTQ